MGKVLAKFAATKQHPLAAELRAVLSNPKASLGELATVVNRINAELKLFEEQSKQQLQAADKSKSESAKSEIEGLRSLVAGIKGQVRPYKPR